MTPSLDRCTKVTSSFFSRRRRNLLAVTGGSTKIQPSGYSRSRELWDPLPADRHQTASPLSQSTYDYERHSQVAGPLAEPPSDGPYRVQFRRLEGSRPVRSTLLVLIALLFVGGFLTWLMLPSHWPRWGDDMLVNIASIIVTATTGIIGWFAFLNVATLCRATLLARGGVLLVGGAAHQS